TVREKVERPIVITRAPVTPPRSWTFGVRTLHSRHGAPPAGSSRGSRGPRAGRRERGSPPRGGHRRRVRRLDGQASAGGGAGARDVARSPQPSPVPAAPLPDRDGGPLAGRHRSADTSDRAQAAQRQRAAGRGRED